VLRFGSFPVVPIDAGKIPHAQHALDPIFLPFTHYLLKGDLAGMLHRIVSGWNQSLSGQTIWYGVADSPCRPPAAIRIEAGANAAEWRETELVARILAGDQEAFAAVERSYGGILRSLARNEFRFSEPDSEDVVHDMLIALMERDYRLLRTYRGQASLGTWLRAVARRRCLGHLRKMAMRQRRSYEAAQDCPCSRYDRDNHIAVHQALSRLSPRDQALVRLFFFDGCSYRDISLALDLPENTVASSIYRAKERLRTMLCRASEQRASETCGVLTAAAGQAE
jgi:RNA polymerase sigma-70 factor (ECF subfamily)